MSFELHDIPQSYADFKAIPEEQTKIEIFAQILNTKAEQEKAVRERRLDEWTWSVGEAQIVVGLYRDLNVNTYDDNNMYEAYLNNANVQQALTEDGKVFGARIIEETAGKQNTLQQLGKKLDQRAATARSAPTPVASRGGNVQQSDSDGSGSDNDDEAAPLINLDDPSGAQGNKSRSSWKGFKRSGFYGAMWGKLNAVEKIAAYGGGTLTAAAAGAGLMTQFANIPLLVNAGTVMAKALPTAIAAFGVSHSVPPAAFAFYALAAVLLLASLAVFFGAKIYKHAKARSDQAQSFVDRQASTAFSGQFVPSRPVV